MEKYKNPTPSLDEDVASKKPKLDKFYPIEETEIMDYTFKEEIYFAFIDVLGFKNKFLNNNTTNNNKKHFSEKFNQIFNYYFYLMNSIQTKGHDDSSLHYAGQTSDSLYFYTDNIFILIEFLKAFSHFNVYSMTQDIFFRGGVAKGNLFYKLKHQFYGSSVINAYLLESEICKDPTIVIDENTYNSFKNNYLIKPNFIKKYNGRFILLPFACLEPEFELDVNYNKSNNFNNLEFKTIDIVLLEKIIKMNKTLFEYDFKNYSKFIFLLDEFEEYKERNKNKIGG